MAALVLLFLPAAVEATETPLAVLNGALDVSDLDSVYDASGRLHVCGIAGDDRLHYWRIGTSGKIEQNVAVNSDEFNYGGCAIATKQYTISGGNYERPVIVSWQQAVGNKYQLIETHDASTSTTAAFTAGVTTNVFTPVGQLAATLVPPALVRYVSSTNKALIVAGATNSGVRLTTQAAGSTTWQGEQYVETLATGRNVFAVTLLADNPGTNQWTLAYVTDRFENSGHTFRVHRQVEGGARTEPYGSRNVAAYTYSARSLSLAKVGVEFYLGVTSYLWVNSVGYHYPTVFELSNGTWKELDVAVHSSGGDYGDSVELLTVNGKLTASYVNRTNRLRVFASWEPTAHGSCSTPFTSNACWYRTSMIYDIDPPKSGRGAVAVRNSTTDAVSYLAPQETVLNPVNYPGSVIGMTARLLKLTCGGTFQVGSGTDQYSAAKIVGSGTTWYAVYRRKNGVMSGLYLRKWAGTMASPTTWGSELEVQAQVQDQNLVADFDVALKGSMVEIAWVNPYGAKVTRRDYNGLSFSSPFDVETGVTTTGGVRVAVFGSRVGYAYLKSGNVRYREQDTGNWLAAQNALDDASYTYRDKSVGLSFNPSTGERRVVGAVAGTMLRTATCAGATCSAWPATPTTLPIPPGSGGSWLDERFGVAYSADGAKVGIVGGGTATALAGKARLYLLQDTGSGFPGNALEIDDGLVGIGDTLSGRSADLRFDAAGNFKAIHYDATNGEARAVRQWRPDDSSSRDVVRWSSPATMLPDVRLGIDDGGEGFTIFSGVDSGGSTNRLYCEPVVL